MKNILFIVYLFCGLNLSAQSYRIMAYNVENFFDYTHDSLKNDYDFLPDGNYHWTFSRFHAKAQKISRVISNIGEGDAPAVVGLCEIENDFCLETLCRTMSNYGYRFIHFESNDERGIDVALLYRPESFRIADSAIFAVDLADKPTRDILYAKGLMQDDDTLHIFLCHLPSQSGGTTETEWKRQAAKDVIREKVQSLLACNPDAKVVVMGDMNSAPRNDIPGLTNRMQADVMGRYGTHKYHGIWTYLDQIYTSPALDSAKPSVYIPDWLLTTDTKYLGKKPHRTFDGYRYDKDGFSDHLPIVLDIKKQL